MGPRWVGFEVIARCSSQDGDGGGSSDAYLLGLQDAANALYNDAQEAIRGSLAAVGLPGAVKSTTLPQGEGQRQGGFDVLRRSLQESDRKWKDLNMNIAGQQEANEGVVATLSTQGEVQ